MDCPTCGTIMEEKIGYIPVTHLQSFDKLSKPSKTRKKKYARYWYCSRCDENYAAVLVLKEIVPL